MAQQLVATRTPAAFAGVASYAHRQTGEAAATAYLSLGYAYLLEGHFAEAVANLKQARAAGDALADYDEYLEARAEHLNGNDAAAAEILAGFVERNPDSIFDSQVPELEAQVLLARSDIAGAQRALASAPGASGRVGYQLAQAEVAQALGQNDEAARLYRRVLLNRPLSAEAQTARSRLTGLGLEFTLTQADLRTLADAFYKAGHYEDAAEQYRALARKSSGEASARDDYEVAAAACDLKLKRLTRAEAEALPAGTDEAGARRLYLLMELARDRDDEAEQQADVDQLRQHFARSPWLAEALFSSGNMYLLRRDYPHATAYYSELAESFPTSEHAAAAHWRAGWLSYRQGLYAQAEHLFEEQIRLYPGAQETVSALYWRARVLEDQDHEPALAAAHYRTLIAAYPHYFYAQIARERLATLGETAVLTDPPLEKYHPVAVPQLVADVPDGDPHLLKAHLLVNAGLSEYVSQEIAASPDSGSWGSLAEARLYASYGEDFRALRVLKRALPSAASTRIASIPLAYWRILFPEPYWETIRSEAARNNLDPYLVASLIRQESEFNSSAISHANAFGLMQLLPSVGRQMAREEGLGSIAPRQLLDPILNIRLGTRYLRLVMDHFGGVPEYALAAYNAGENRVADWQAAGPYTGLDEFVESIPFTETRGYVEAILRNEEMYRAIDRYAEHPAASEAKQSGTQPAKRTGVGGQFSVSASSTD
uniref:Putative Lytic transglycosylase, catalytic n=1 Tax=mine drainage metagenome TaxID=410659 RepID=E6QI16_9ZZZZ